MHSLDRIAKTDLRELLVKGWMTHDAMWFYHCLAEAGIETVSRINIAAVTSMAAIEIRRIRKTLGHGDLDIQRFDELAAFLTEAFELVKGEFMKFHFVFPVPNILRWEWEQGECFAYQGIQKLGVIEGYRCGIIKRIEGWLTGLGVSYEMAPPVDRCLMHTIGHCAGEIRFQFT